MARSCVSRRPRVALTEKHSSRLLLPAPRQTAALPAPTRSAIARHSHPASGGFIGIAAISPILRESFLPLPSSLCGAERCSLHSPQLRARRRTNSQTVRALEPMCAKERRPSTRAAGCPPPVTWPTRQKEMNMTTKIVLTLALAMSALASVPASASPHHDWQVAGNCQEDLGYGRTSGWGCG